MSLVERAKAVALPWWSRRMVVATGVLWLLLGAAQALGAQYGGAVALVALAVGALIQAALVTSLVKVVVVTISIPGAAVPAGHDPE